MAATSDHNVTETAFDAVKCKLSAVTQGYFRDDFLRLVVDKPSRRIPLIHRGYYLRHVAITHHVDEFLAQHASAPVNVVSLGAGFDTLFFRLVQAEKKCHVRFVEVDCAPIVSAKAALLRGRMDEFFPTSDVVMDKDDTSDGIAFNCEVSEGAETSSYALFACDLGDTETLTRCLKTLRIDTSLPTLVIAECVVSYLEPERGTALLGWLAATFDDATAVFYDPIALNDVFGATLQRYFAVKGCKLRSLREFQTANDHFHRLLALANWRTCAIMNMNEVYARFTTSEDKKRLSTLEPFDEHADWWLSNAHYAIFVATNSSHRSTVDLQAYKNAEGSLMATSFPLRDDSAPVIVRTFQSHDLARVQELFQSTHLDFAETSKAVRKFVEKRLQPPHGDMVDVARSFRSAGSGFWVAEVDGNVVGCIGVKPTDNVEGSEANGSVAELCRLSVDASFRRRGIASALITTLEESVRGHGYRAICLETIGVMTAAQHFYRAHGYTETTTSTFASFSLVRFEKSLVQ